MRVLVLDTYYPALIAHHYEAGTGSAEAGYAAQLAALMELRFGTSDAYTQCLGDCGVEAVDLIVNCDPLQRAWAVENGGPALPLELARRLPGRFGRLATARARARIVRAQIDAYGPDILYLQALNALPAAELRRQRALGRFVVGQIASPLPSAETVKSFDLILTSFPHFVERIRALGVAAEYFPIAFDRRVLDVLGAEGIAAAPAAPRPHDVVFVGGLDPSVHQRGTALLERLSRRVPLQIWGYGAAALPADSPLRACHRGEAWGMDMYRILAGAKLVLNRHSSAAEGYANNMRLFEATGVGALLLTEASPNLSTLFEPGSELVAYSEFDDLVESVERLLDDEGERRRIAAAGQRRTLSDHSYQTRIPELAEILETYA